MVFTTIVNFMRRKGPDEFWKKRKIFKLSAHYVGRRRNCYSIAIRNVHRALVYATKGRELKREVLGDLWVQRIHAGASQHGLRGITLREALSRNSILLNKKTLSELACWEPYSFKALTDIAHNQAEKDNLFDMIDKRAK